MSLTTPNKARPSQQRGVSIALVLLVLLLAALAGAFVAYLIITRVDVTLALRDQPATAIIPQQIIGRARIDGEIGLQLTETIRTQVPVDQRVTIPVKDQLNIVAHFKGAIPLQLMVKLQDEIPLRQVIDLNTKIEAYLPELGSTISIPIRGKIPIDTMVPVDLDIPVDQMINLEFVTPVTAKIDQSLNVPLRTTIDAEVPIDAGLNVPVLNELEAVVNLPLTPSNVVITEGNLTLPLRSLKLQMLSPQRDQP